MDKRTDVLCDLGIDEINENEDEYGIEFYQKDAVDSYLTLIEDKINRCYDLLDKIAYFSDIDTVYEELEELKDSLY
jgi:hypothetical protein